MRVESRGLDAEACHIRATWTMDSPGCYRAVVDAQGGGLDLIFLLVGLLMTLRQAGPFAAGDGIASTPSEMLDRMADIAQRLPIAVDRQGYRGRITAGPSFVLTLGELLESESPEPWEHPLDFEAMGVVTSEDGRNWSFKLRHPGFETQAVVERLAVIYRALASAGGWDVGLDEHPHRLREWLGEGWRLYAQMNREKETRLLGTEMVEREYTLARKRVESWRLPKAAGRPLPQVL